MTESTAPVKRKRLPILLALTGCVMFAVCALFVFITGAGYWVTSRVDIHSAYEPQAGDQADIPEQLPAGDPDSGEQVFMSEAGCKACHSLEPDVRIVGPSLSGVGARAPENYIYESIVNPNASVVSGFQRGIMPENYQRKLSLQQLADLVAFLKTR